MALRLLGDREEAMEAMQDSFFKVFDRLHAFRGESPFWGWLRQVAVNEALMRLRRRGPLDYVELLPEPEPDADGHGLPPCSSAHWPGCRRRRAACCGCTTARATRMKRSAS